MKKQATVLRKVYGCNYSKGKCDVVSHDHLDDDGQHWRCEDCDNLCYYDDLVDAWVHNIKSVSCFLIDPCDTISTYIPVNTPKKKSLNRSRAMALGTYTPKKADNTLNPSGTATIVPAKIAFHIFQFGVYDRQRRFANLVVAKKAVEKQAEAQFKRGWYGEWKKVGVNKWAYNVHNSKGTVQFTIGLTKKGN